MDCRLLASAVAGGIVVFDRLTKLWIEANVELYVAVPVFPGLFDIVHTQNRGIAFGLFAESRGPWRTTLLTAVAFLVSSGLAALIWRLPRERPARPMWSAASLGLILGGAIGNLYDRIVRGSVTDFLDVHVGAYHWPAFNVADSAITVGAVLLAIEMLRSPRPEERHAR
jgi:signal peptidase II